MKRMLKMNRVPIAKMTVWSPAAPPTRIGKKVKFTVLQNGDRVSLGIYEVVKIHKDKVRVIIGRKYLLMDYVPFYGPVEGEVL